MEYQLEEISGTEFTTLEECQDTFLDQLARLLADIFRQEFADKLSQECGTIEKPKLLEAINV